MVKKYHKQIISALTIVIIGCGFLIFNQDSENRTLREQLMKVSQMAEENAAKVEVLESRSNSLSQMVIKQQTGDYVDTARKYYQVPTASDQPATLPAPNTQVPNNTNGQPGTAVIGGNQSGAVYSQPSGGNFEDLNKRK